MVQALEQSIQGLFMFSRDQQTVILNAIRAQSLELALYSTSPTSQDTGTEISGGNYTRKSITFDVVEEVADGSQISNSGVITFNQATADWSAPVAYWAVRITGGAMVAHGVATSLGVPSTRVVRAGDVFQLAIGDVVLKIKD